MHLLKYWLVVLLFSLLSGCVTQVAVKDITVNKQEFVTQNFSKANISKDVTAQLSKDSSSPLYKKMLLKLEVVIETTRGEKQSSTIDHNIVDLGNGVTQEIYEFSNNDLPYLLRFSNGYRGIMQLSSLTTRLNRTIAPFPVEIKQFQKFTPLPTTLKQGEEYEYAFLTGSKPQLFGFYERKLHCKSGISYAAKQLHTNLSGTATDLDCELFKNNVVDVKSKLVFLQAYGIALPTVEIDSNSTAKYKIVEAKIE